MLKGKNVLLGEADLLTANIFQTSRIFMSSLVTLQLNLLNFKSIS
jgi:hypothetical protein